MPCIVADKVKWYEGFELPAESVFRSARRQSSPEGVL